MNYYILNEEKQPVLVDPETGILFWTEENKRVDKTYITKDVFVSTIFLGLDHNWYGGEPILFETMVFGGEWDMECERYHTWDEAVAGHKLMVERVTNETRKE